MTDGHKSSLGNQVARDTARAGKGISPDINVDTYGGPSGRNPAPKAAQFGKGAQSLAEIKDATRARVDQRPGDFYRNSK